MRINVRLKVIKDLRRVSGLLLCELFYNNPVVKEEFIYTLEISPNNGRVTFINIF